MSLTLRTALTLFFILCLPWLAKAGNSGPSMAFLGLSLVSEPSPSLPLDAPDKFLSACFEVNADMEVRALAVFCDQSEEAPPYLLSLHKEEKGGPGRELARSSGIAPRAQSWVCGQLDGLALAKGSRVCLKISPDLLRGGSHPVDQPSPSRFASFKASAPEKRPGQALPLHALLGRGKRIQGNGWGESLALPIHGNGTEADPSDDRWQAQVFHFDCGFNARTLKARVRKLGRPKHPLKWVLLRHDYKAHKTSPIYEAVLAPSSKVEESWAWVEAAFPSNTGYPPECHYVALKSESGTGTGGSCSDCYEVSGQRLAGGLELVQELGFNGGAHRDRASSSVNGGHWTDDFDADLHLGILAPPCMPKDGPKAPRLVPTPHSPLP